MFSYYNKIYTNLFSVRISYTHLINIRTSFVGKIDVLKYTYVLITGKHFIVTRNDKVTSMSMLNVCAFKRVPNLNLRFIGPPVNSVYTWIFHETIRINS